MAGDELAFTTIAELTGRLRRRDLSVRDVAEAFLARIEQVDGLVNAWVTVDPERVLREAEALDRSEDARSRPLYGVPAGIKDLTPTSGLRTTFGSTLFRDHVPGEDAVIVQRLRAAGALIIGKTNTPEFGVGGNTFNAVAGATRNPWDLTKSAGGSSGGSAAALASGTCVVAEGSDMGGSLRIPAAFCGVVGFRTSPGFVPDVPAELPWDTLSVTGPMARTVEDVETMLSVVFGPHPASPLSLPWSRGTRWVRPYRDPVRVALSTGRDLVDVDPRVEQSVHAAGKALESVGCDVVLDAPDLSGSEEVIRTLRAARMDGLYGKYEDAVVHPGLADDISRGRKLTARDLILAEVERGRLYARTVGFWDRYDVLVLPTTPVPPFPLDWVAPTEVGESRFDIYSDWMILTHAISLMGWPSLAVPTTPTDDGLPLGVQLVGPVGSEWHLLEVGRWHQDAMGWTGRFPPLALSGPEPQKT